MISRNRLAVARSGAREGKDTGQGVIVAPAGRQAAKRAPVAPLTAGEWSDAGRMVVRSVASAAARGALIGALLVLVQWGLS